MCHESYYLFTNVNYLTFLAALRYNILLIVFLEWNIVTLSSIKSFNLFYNNNNNVYYLIYLFPTHLIQSFMCDTIFC